MKAEKVPFVSVIVSTYEGAKTIEECVKSLVSQDYPKDKYEIIVVNDGSTDDTGKLLKKYPVKVIEHEENMGLSSARNTGVKNSKGDIIAFTDDDCVASPSWIKNLVKKYDGDVWGVGGSIKPHTRAGVFERYALVSRNPIYSHAKVIKPKERVKEYLTSVIAGAPRLRDGDTLTGIMGCNSSYRKRVIEEVGPFNSAFKRGGDDWEYAVRIGRTNCTLKYAEDAVVYHRHRENFLSFVKHLIRYGEDSILVSKKTNINPLPYPLPVLFFISLPFVLINAEFLIFSVGILGLSLIKEIPYSMRQDNVMKAALPILENIREFAYDVGMVRGLIKYRGY